MEQNKSDLGQTSLRLLKTVVLPLAIVFIAELFYREPLYNESLSLIPELQSHED